MALLLHLGGNFFTNFKVETKVTKNEFCFQQVVQKLLL